MPTYFRFYDDAPPSYERQMYTRWLYVWPRDQDHVADITIEDP